MVEKKVHYGNQHKHIYVWPNNCIGAKTKKKKVHIVIGVTDIKFQNKKKNLKNKGEPISKSSLGNIFHISTKL